jgi:hypothetical protein
MTPNEKALGEALSSLTVTVQDLQHWQHTAMKVLKDLAAEPAALREPAAYLQTAAQQLETVRSQLQKIGVQP